MPNFTNPNYDVLVIGGGSAGYAAASASGKGGARTALVTSAGPLGGLCILKGCMPSKTLIETANRLRDIREAGEFGIETPPGAKVNLKALQERKAELIGGFQDYRVGQLNDGEFELLRGSAQLVSPHEVELEDGMRLSAKVIILATGSSSFIPPVEGLEEVPYVTSDELLEVECLPDHLLVLGGGVIGMEFAHCFEGFGSRVTVIQRSEGILTALESDLGEVLEDVSRKRGIEFCLGCEAQRVSFAGGVFTVQLDDGRILEGDQFLVATGRRANTKSLKVEAAGLAMDGDRIEIDGQCRTSVGHIFAAGDCASLFPYVHLAVIQGEVAAANALHELGMGGEPKEWNPRLNFAGIFTHPEMVQLGMTQKECEEAGMETVAASYPFSEHGKAMIVGATEGFVTLIAEKKSGILVGARAIGPGVVDYSHFVLAAMAQKMTAAEFAKLPFYHPTLAEIWFFPAEELAGE